MIYAGDAYTDAFVDTVMAIAPPRWAHTEDAGIDGRFYDDMRAKGVAVTHSPGANAPEVAEFAFAGVMWGAKRLAEFRDLQRAHQWRQLDQTALSAATILVVGLGAIGSRIAAYASAFGMTVHGIRRSPEAVRGVDRQGTLADLADFLPEADFVVLAIPNTDETLGLIGRDAFARMKPTATLVNVGRGALVDVVALRRRARLRRHRPGLRRRAAARALARRQRPLGHPEPVHLSPRRLRDAALHGARRRDLAGKPQAVPGRGGVDPPGVLIGNRVKVQVDSGRG